MTSEGVATWIIAAAAFVAAAAYLVKILRIGARKLDKLDELLNKLDELDHVLTTVTEDVPAMAVALGAVQGQLAELEEGLNADRRRLTRLVLLGARHHPDAADDYLSEDT